MPAKSEPITITHPALADEWDWEKNGTLTPDKVSYGTSTKINWVCSEGHKWVSSCNNRVKPGIIRGCPYCSGRLVIAGLTDFATTEPGLLKEWDYVRNTRLPTDVPRTSMYRAYWLCSEGHSYQSRMDARTVQGSGCPYCTGRLAVSGETDLATLRPRLMEEWDYEKNAKQPTEYTLNSHSRAHWICSKEHRWEATIAKRTHSGRDCPICALTSQTSKIEVAYFKLFEPKLSECVNTFITEVKWPSGHHLSVDIYGLYGGKKVAIEYDGGWFHKASADKDTRKSLSLLQQGYHVVRIRGKGLTPLNINHPNYFDVSASEPYKADAKVVDKIINWLK